MNRRVMTSRAVQIDRRLIIITVLAVAILVWVSAFEARHPWFLGIDVATWKDDWPKLIDCLRQDAIGRCGVGVSQFPLAYLLNSFVVSFFGYMASEESVLLCINLVFLSLPLAVLALLHKGFASVWRAGAIYVAALALSPLPAFYVYSAALEIQSGIICGIFIACLVAWIQQREVRSPAALYGALLLSGFAFPFYKDTVVVVMGASIAAAWMVLSLRSSRLLRLPAGGVKAFLLLVITPIVVSVALAAVYNQVKYGLPLPVRYMDVAMNTSPPWYKSIEFLLGSIFSPNGGVLVFWFLPLSFAAWALVWLGGKLEAIALTIAGIGAGLSAVSFSLWWATFGWDAWGDRLMIPPVLALLVAGVLTASFNGETRRAGGGRDLLCYALAIPLLFYSAYYYMVPYMWHRTDKLGALLVTTMDTGPACEEVRLQYRRNGIEYWRSEAYYRCARERMLHVPMP